MKNKNAFLMTILILLTLILGCSFYNPLSDSANNANLPITKDKDLSEKTADQTTQEEKIGIPECDELLDFLADQTKSEDDNFVTKGFREYYLNTIREALKKSIEENKNDPTEMAKECKKLKAQLDKYKAQEESKK
jgi:hypothetical protein